MKLIRKLIVGISTICLLVMTFVSATYAWFEINSRASVENFHFEVHGGQGFLVSIDNVNYYNDLSLIQLQKAMLVAYGAGEYRLATDGSEELYYVYYEDAFDEHGNVVKYERTSIVQDDRIAELVSQKIKLYPTTSFDGRNLTDMYNATTKVNSGNYVQFDVYFRTQSRRLEDNFAYEIYLNGENSTTDDGSILEPTIITSDITEFDLSTNMNAIKYHQSTKYVKALKRNNASNARDKITVYSSNAVRLSITENSLKEYDVLDDQGNPVTDEAGNPQKGYKYEVTNADATKIYELNDTINKDTDLGSYATDYTGGKTETELKALINSGSIVDPNVDVPLEDENLALYCSTFNAMYTYYNNLKPDAKITHISYDSKPTTIRDLSTKDTITKVVSGEEAKLLTFRLWLEGWDADCFDGIKYSVRVRLAFGSRRVYE